MSHRRAKAAALTTCALAICILGTSRATAAPGEGPTPQPVVGPVQFVPPAYPAAVGVPLIPRGRAGVAPAADSVNPTAQQPVLAGIAGVGIAADTVAPAPLSLPPTETPVIG